MATSNMHNLTTLIKRLEAATSRLEDIATSVAPFDQVGGSPASGLAITSPPEEGASPQPGALVVAAQAPSAPPKPELPAEVEGFDKLVTGELAAFIKLSDALDPLLGKQAGDLQKTFAAERALLLVSKKAKKPSENTTQYLEVFGDIQTHMEAVDEHRQKHRASPLKDHLAMVADGVATLGWVAVEYKPADYAAELFGGAQMSGNKVLKQYKERDEHQVEWVNAFYKLMRSLIAYIKQYYSGGITWNPEGVSVSEAIREVEATANGHAPSTGGPPPPPPLPTHLLSSGGPPPPPLPAKAQAGNDMGAVFDELNQGEAITSGLKKVDQSQMTHKNPALRGSAPVPERSNSGASLKSIPPHTKPKPESMRTKKPPKMVLERSKWLIENFDSPTKPVEVKADVHHSILISKCRNATIRVSGKCNAISIDSSSKLSVIVDTLVSSVDVIKCPSFAIQVLGSVPTVLLDQVDGAAVYLGGGSLATEVLTSKCTAVNVYFPHAGGDEDDYKESNVPEQFRSVIRDGRLVTEILQHS